VTQRTARAQPAGVGPDGLLRWLALPIRKTDRPRRARVDGVGLLCRDP
jgi:hypothetical protein